MGVYAEYLSQKLDLARLEAERKKQLRRISELRGGRDILVISADMSNHVAPTSIDYSDLLAINDQLSNLSGTGIDIILETPGGSGEVVEDIVESIRHKYANMAVLVPGWAKSAGTIMAMAADSILMEPSSALGPIDAQIAWQGKRFSAEALLEGIENIKKETQTAGALNLAYVPILSTISPGELENAKNALSFARVLVTQWLALYKFNGWTTHSSTGEPVTDDERKARAKEVADRLCNHKEWLTHARSIKMADLTSMRLQIEDYSQNAPLADAIRRHHTLTQMTFTFGIYKMFETLGTQIYRIQPNQVPVAKGTNAVLDVKCNTCQALMRVQANLGVASPLAAGMVAFPANNKLACASCGAEIDLSAIREQIEAQTQQPVIT